MITDLKPYAEYKESGLPWLGQVPRHWEIKRPKHIGELLKGIGGTKEDSRSAGVPCVRYGELYTTHQYFIRRPKAFVEPARASAYTPIRYGDVLFAGSGEKLEEIGKSAVNLIEGEAVCGGDTIVLRPRINVFAPFLGYAFDCRPSALQKASMGRGTTVKHIYPDELKQLQIPLPPPDEQAAIVRFLDWANGRLERAIRAKRKVIALLNEQKQAIIHRAVTRGLDPSVPLKDSGVPWLGEIPEHWEVKKLRFLFRYAKGSRAAELTNEYIGRNAGEFPVFSGQTEHDGLMGEISWHEFDFDSPVVFVSTVGARAMTTRILSGKFSLSQNCALIVPRNRQGNPLYFENVFQRLFAFERYSISQIMQPSLRFSDLNRFYVPHPPVEEQLAIAAEIAREIGKLNTAICRLEREITLLREYRTRLVADVVTGKLDVRAAAAALPDEALLDDVAVSRDPDDDAYDTDDFTDTEGEA
jgi:type I restriction enzyme S subunit